MAMIVAVALFGYFGHGPRSAGRIASSGAAYEVEYPRYARHRAPDALRVVIRKGAVGGDEARLTFGQRYLEGVEVESVFPEPDSVEVGNDEVVYTFKLSSDGAPATVSFSLTYEDLGRKSGMVRLDGHPSVSFSQFVYP